MPSDRSAEGPRGDRALLKPGGILVCEDHDDRGIFTEPGTSTYRRFVEISEAVNQAHGLDSNIGLKLPRLFRTAGFARTEVRVEQYAFLRGNEKRFWELTLREAGPATLAAGASTRKELDTLCCDMQAIANDDSVLLMLARVTQVGAQVADGRGWAVVVITESFEAVSGEADDYCCSDVSFDAVSPWLGFRAGFSISLDVGRRCRLSREARGAPECVRRFPVAQEIRVAASNGRRPWLRDRRLPACGQAQSSGIGPTYRARGLMS